MAAFYFSSHGPYDIYQKTAVIWSVKNNKFYAYNGDGLGNSVTIDTGFAVNPMQWQRVGLWVDVIHQTYDFYLNGVKFNPSSPLKFVGAPSDIEMLGYNSSTYGWVDAITVSDVLVPEPSTAILLAIGAFCLLAYVCPRSSWRWR